MTQRTLNGSGDGRPLAGLRVLDLSTVVAGPFGSDILATLGAEVIRIAPPSARRDAAEPVSNGPVCDADGFYYAFQRNKQMLHLNLKDEADRARFFDLVTAADVVYDNFRPGVTRRLGIDYRSLKQVNRRIITCSISGYGAEGPWASVGAYDVTVQALGGAMSITGNNDDDHMPCRWGIPIGDITGSFYIVIGLLAALEERGRSGLGQAVDVSLLDGQLALNTYRVPQAFGADMRFGVPQPRRGGAGTVPYGPYRCADDRWIVIGVASNFWRPFCEAVGMGEIAGDARFDSLARRQDNQAILEPILEQLFMTASAGDWQQRLMAAGVPVGKVNTIREAFEQPQSRARCMAVKLQGTPTGNVMTAGNPIRFVGEAHPVFAAPSSREWQPDDRIPDIGGQSESPPAHGAIARLAALRGPLNGRLVLELCGDEPSGTFGTQILADLGATVVKVERPPVGETAACDLASQPVTPALAYYFGLNRNKRSICLDLKSKSGLAAFMDLASNADVVYDNHRTGVMERLGIDAGRLRAVNPDIIACSVSGFGKTGPWSHLPAYDATIQALGGGMSITGNGRAGEMPIRCGNPVGGLGGAFYAVIGILSALHRRSRGLGGASLDIALLDAQLAMHGYRVAPALSGRHYPASQRRGGSGALPYGPFKCRDGKWFVLGVTDQFWPAAARALGHPEWIEDPRFHSEASRQDHEAALNALVTDAIAVADAGAWESKFVKLGIPGARVCDIREAFDHPHVALRNMIVGFDHPVGGRLKVAGSPVKLSNHAFKGFRHAPALGEDTREVLTDLARLSPDRIEALRSDGVIWWSEGRLRYDRPSVV